MASRVLLHSLQPALIVGLALVGIALSSSGCATIVNSSTMDVAFESEPEGAAIFVDGERQACKTPCSVAIKASTTHEIALKLDGYEDEHDVLQRRVSGWFWANFSFVYFAPIGMAVDYFSGKMFSLRENRLAYDLDAIKAEAEPKKKPPPVVVEPEPEPLVSPRMRRIREMFPPAFVRDTIVDYYGELSPEERAETEHRLYLQLLHQDEAGDRLDLDQAISADQFRPDAGKKKPEKVQDSDEGDADDDEQ